MIILGQKLTHEEFANRIHGFHPEIEFLSEYIYAKSKIKCMCKTCGNVWETTPNSLNQGCGCPKCGDKMKSIRQLKTHDQFINRMSNINSNIKIIGKYQNARSKIECECLIDGYHWFATPDNLLHGTGCPKCSGRVQNTEIFKERLKDIQPHIEVVGEYINNSTKIDCICHLHNFEFKSTPQHLLQGKGCKYCKSEKLSKYHLMTHEEFVDRVNKLNADIAVVGRYISAQQKVLVKCKKCNTEFNVIPNNVKTRNHIYCPSCHQKESISVGEKLIKNYLSDHDIYFIHEYKYDGLLGVNGGQLSYDFYLPFYNILIEFQGEQHERPVEYFGGDEKFHIQQEHDKRKREYAAAHNITLLEIWYDEIDRIDSILDNYLQIKKVS